MNKKLKNVIYTGLAVLTLTGTFGGIEGGIPIINPKKGSSLGINIGLVSEFMPQSKFYGVDISFCSRYHKGSELCGINSSLFNIHGGNIYGATIAYKNIGDGGEINGLEVALVNTARPGFDRPVDINGLQLAAGNFANNVNGLQLAPFCNFAERVNGTQLSVLYNDSENGGTLAQVSLINKIKKRFLPILNLNL